MTTTRDQAGLLLRSRPAAPTARHDSTDTGPLRRWRALRARRRTDQEWARAVEAAVTPSLRDELLLLRALG